MKKGDCDSPPEAELIWQFNARVNSDSDVVFAYRSDDTSKDCKTDLDHGGDIYAPNDALDACTHTAIRPATLGQVIFNSVKRIEGEKISLRLFMDDQDVKSREGYGVNEVGDDGIASLDYDILEIEYDNDSDRFKCDYFVTGTGWDFATVASPVEYLNNQAGMADSQ